MKRLMTIMLVLLFAVPLGCGGPDLRPAMGKIQKSMEIFKPDLEAYWASDAFMKDMPDELREEGLKNRKELLDTTLKTIELALKPEKDEEPKKGKKKSKPDVDKKDEAKPEAKNE